MEALARSCIETYDDPSPQQQPSDDVLMQQAVALSLLDSGGQSSDLHLAADRLLRDSGPIPLGEKNRLLRKFMIEPSGWCFLDACLKQLGEISSHGLTREGLFLSMLEKL